MQLRGTLSALTSYKCIFFDILNIKHWILIFKIILKTKIDFKCEIKIASRWQHVTCNKWVTASEPNHLNDSLNHSGTNHSCCSEMQNSAMVVGAYFFVGEMEQKHGV